MKKCNHNGIEYVAMKRFRPINNDYRLLVPYEIQTEITGCSIKKELIELHPDGLLCLHKGFWWNGPSGPTVDTENFMRGSLVHDALYRLRRWKLLPWTVREYADDLLYEICIEDGMSAFRAGYVHTAVRMKGLPSALPGGDHI